MGFRNVILSSSGIIRTTRREGGCKEIWGNDEDKFCFIKFIMFFNVFVVEVK